MPEETNILSNQAVSQPSKKNVWVDKYQIPVYTDLKRADEILYATDTQVLNRPKKNYFAMTDLGTSTEELGDEALKKVPVLSTVMGGAGYLTNWLTKNQFMRGALKSAADMTRQGVAGLLKETGNVSAFLGQDVDSRINRAKEIDQKFANLPVPIRAQELLLQNMHAVFEGFKPFNPEYAKERVEALKKEQEKIDTFNRKVKTIVDSFTSAAGLDKTGKDGFFYDFGAGASSFLFSVGALALTRNPALVAPIFGVIEGQGTYEQAIEAGIEPEKAMILGKANQAWITATEVIGEGLLNKLLFEKGVLGKAAVRILKRAKGQSSRQIALKAAGIGALQGGGIEGVQEAIQNVGSDVINILGGADEKTVSDIIKDALYAGLLAFPLGGAAGGVGGAVHFATYANNIKTRLVNAGVKAETAESIANETAVEAISEEMTNDTLHAVSSEINSPLTANDRNPQAFARTLTESQQREIAQNAWNVGQRVEQEALKAGRPAEEAKASGEVAQALSNGIFRLAKLTPTEQTQFKINILRGDSAAPAVALNQDGIYKNGKADISTPAFRNWFGNSKVVDEKGAPLVVYHGTNASFSVFDTRKTQTPMFWFTGDKASLSDGRTSTNAKGGIKKVMEVYLNIKNPANSEQYENFTIDQLKARGFDGVKLSKQEGYASDMYIAFYPEQIKSVYNRGTWSTDNPNIYYQTEGTEQENNQNPAFSDELNAILKSAPNKVATAVIGRVSAPLSVAAREHGLNIDGYIHNIDNSAIQHTRKRHGLPQREERLGQLAVTDEDFKNIPQIIYTPDFVAFGAKNKKGLDLIIYGKNMPDGSSIYVEEIRTGKKTLTTNSLRKYKTGVNPSSFANRISNAHGDTGTISIVGKEDFVKTKKPLNLFQMQNMFAPNAQTAQRFKAEVQSALNDESVPKGKLLNMGNIPPLYAELGLPEGELKTNKTTLLKAIGKSGRHPHNVPQEVLEKLPALVADPKAVFKSSPNSTNPDGYVVVLDATNKDGAQIIAAISPSKKGEKGFYFIPSVYDKGAFANFVRKTAEEGGILYVKEKDSDIWGTLQSRPRHNQSPTNSIRTKEDFVNRENTFFQGGLFDNQPDLFTSQAEIEENPGTDPENAPRETLFTPQEMAPTLPEFKPAHKPAPVRIEDFGEKIIGARKDLWGKYKNAMQKDIPDAAAGVTLSEFFPEINYDAAIAQGIQVDQLAAVKALRDSIPAKPQRYGQKEWLLQLKTARGIANDILSGKTTVEAFKERVRYTKYLAGKLELYLELGYPLFTKARAFDFTANRYTIYQGQQFAEPQIVYEFRQGYKRLFASSNRDEVLDFAKKHLENLPSKANVPTKLDIYQIRSTGEIVIGKKIASGKYVDLKGGFTRVSDATKYLDENRAHLEALLEEKKKMPPLRSDENAPRIGKEYRPQATVVTPERFLQEFGFRGVQFGNWVEQERRAQDLNNAYDALLDMADIIGLPARALSLEGKLGLAFGARGNSKASAHYEHGETVINLTKIKGAGSLGHEWWHALDNYFGRKSNKDAMATNGISENIRPEMQAAYKELVQTVTSVMGERSANADQTRKTDYWKTPVEMTARAFESYLISKAKAKGYRNDYLANVIDLATYKKKGGREEAYPYPMESEMPVLDAAFDKFFATIQTAPIEQGYTLYQGEADFGPRGQVTLDEQAHEAVIKVFQKADPSTVVHELAHVYLTMIQQAAGVSTDTEFANFLSDLNGWLGEPTERGYTRQQQEKFAQGFEAYLAEGKAPNKQLEGVFKQFARWLADIYRAVKDKLHITPEVRSIFDRLMAPSEPVRRSRVGEKLDAAKRLVEQMKKGKGAEVDGISLADIKELVNTLSIRKPKGPETDLLKDLRKHGAEYANAGQIDKEAYKNARVYDKKGGVDDRPDVWLQKMGYMDFADSSEDTLQQAYDMIQRALDGEKVYRLADQAQADERAAYEENLNTILQVFPDIKTAKETLKAISVLEAQGYRAVEKKDISALERRLNELEHLTNTGQNTKAGESAFRAADRLRRETANEINKRQLENKEQLLKWLNQAKTTQEIRQATEDVLNYLEQQYAKTDEAKQEKEMLEVPKTDYGALKIKILKSISDINKKASQEVKWARAALAEEGRARRTGRSISAEEKASFDKARRIIDDSVGAPYKKAISAALEGIRHLPAADKGKFLRSFMGARYLNFLPEEIDNLLKRAKTIEETNYKKHMDTKIREMLKQKLFDKSGSGKKALFDAETMNALGELKQADSMTPEEAAQKLHENISWSMNHPEAKLSTASKIVNEILSLRANGINESSMELFKQAYDDIRALRKAGRSAMNLQKMVRDFRTEQAKDEALAALKKNAQAGLLKRLFLGHIGNWESFLDLAFDKTTKEHYSMLNEEADAMSFAWEQRKAILEGAKRIYGLESNSALQDKINELLKEKEVFMNYSHIDTNPDPAAIRKTGEVFAEELSKMQIINLYIWNKNSVLADRLKNQYKGQLPAMFGRLTSQDRRFGDFLQQSAEQYYRMINSVFVKERGYDLPKAEAYFPSKTERVESELDLLQTAVVMSKNPSFTKFRTDSKMVQMKPANPLNILFNHLEKAADYKFKSEKINEIRRVFKSPILRPELERVLTTDGYQQFQRMIDQFSVDQQKASYDIDKLGDWLTNNYVRGAIALKPSIAIKQLVSAMNYAENMPALKWTEGFIKAVLHPKETVKFMLEADPYLRARYESGSMNEALERMASSADGINKMQKALSFTNLMSLSTRLGDIGAIAFGGKPYVDYLMTEKGMSKEEAFREVRKSTMRTQQFSGKSSLSRWQVQGKNGGYVMRALLAFRNTPAQYARKIAESISEYQRGEISAAQLGKVVAIYAVFNSWVYSLLTSLSLLAWLNGDDDADEMFFSDFILSPFTQVASALPILGEAVSLATEMAKAKVFDKKLNSFGMAEMPLLSDLTRMAAKAMKEDVTGKDILDMFMTMGQYGLGLPSQYLVNIPGAVKDIGEGNAMRGFLKLLGYTKNRAEIATGTKDKK